MGLDNQYHSMGGPDFHIAMTDMLLTGFPVAGDTSRMFPALRNRDRFNQGEFAKNFDAYFG
jgi:hypothetical protein